MWRTRWRGTEVAEQTKLSKALGKLEEALNDGRSGMPGYKSEHPMRAALASKLERMVLEVSARRRPLEDKMFEAALLYAGREDPETEARLKEDPNRSKLVVNLCRPQTLTFEARILDVIQPTDQSSWAIEPAKLPALHPKVVAGAMEQAKRIVAEEEQAKAQAAQAAQEQAQGGEAGGGDAAQPVAPAASNGVREPDPDRAAQMDFGRPPAGSINEGIVNAFGAERWHRLLVEKSYEVAAKRERTMRDVLDACDYSEEERKVVHEASRLGHSWMKGPYLLLRERQAWSHVTLPDGRVETRSRMEPDERPVYSQVSGWNMFCDPDATSVEDMEYAFELHRLSRTALRKYMRTMKFDRRGVSMLLRQQPRIGRVYQDFIRELNEIERSDNSRYDSRYYLWEFTGTLEAEDFAGIAREMGGKEGGALMEAVFEEDGAPDPFAVANVKVFFCQGVFLGLKLNPLDSGELGYSCYAIDKELSTPYGDGVPNFIAHSQRATTAGWRVLMDNGGLAGLPAFVISQGLTPLDGNDRIYPGKRYKRRAGMDPKDPGLFPIQIAGNTQQIVEIIQLAKQHAAEEGMVPPIASGADSGRAETAHGLTLKASAINTIFRNAIRNYDAMMTKPNIQRLHQWLNQFAKDDEEKGNIEVVARGSSVLLVREVAATQRMTILNTVAQNPALGDAVNLYMVADGLFESMQMDRDKVMYSRQTYEANRRRRQELEAQAGAQAAQAEQIKAQVQIQLQEMKVEAQLKAEEMRMETEDKRIEASREKAQMDAQVKELAVASKERTSAAEFGVKARGGTGI